MRNLNADEIYDQVVAIDKQSRLYHNHKLTNIVFMGMGEPLMNYNNVIKAIEKNYLGRRFRNGGTKNLHCLRQVFQK